jgi:hypothetical protein
MSRVGHHVGPPWPPLLSAYDYLSTVQRRDWAWEYLRRHEAYQAHAETASSTPHISIRLESGALLTRLREPQPRVEAWGLCCFR